MENLLNEGVYEMEKFKEGGWITDIKYDDEVRCLYYLCTDFGLTCFFARQ